MNKEMAISCVQLKENEHFNCIRWLNNSDVKFCDNHKKTTKKPNKRQITYVYKDTLQ